MFLMAASRPAGAQLGGLINRGQQVREQVRAVTISDDDEQAIGAGVSQRVRVRYGVVQDPAVHKYVTLTGLALAKASPRPDLPWTFIVLDTDGVNAFAAPGGSIHITRGALALVEDESELAGVLAHEITHVTEKHTISAIQKNKLVAAGANEALKGNAALLNQYVDKAFELVYAGFGRAEELESDSRGIALADTVGYAPGGLGSFLTRLTERNRSSSEKQGLFASHPEMKERLDKLSGKIAADRLGATATLAERYQKAITYKPRPLAGVALVPEGSAGLAGGGDGKDGAKKDDAPAKKGGFALPGLARGSASGSSEKRSAEVTASGGSRGVDTERNAKGGPSPALVVVIVSAADLAAFKKEGGLR